MTWAVAGLLLLSAGCNRPEENTVTPVQSMAGAAPAVDRERPVRLETATFAVG